MSDLTDVTRKLVAVFAADVEGYSRLMGADEVGTARTLREHRKVTDALVEKHGGRLVKSTGDGVFKVAWISASTSDRHLKEVIE
jgi:class 3 adenylate cyclase